MKIPKILDKILTIIVYIFTIVPYLILGAYAADSADKLVTSDNVGLELILMGVLLFLALAFMFVHIIIHEGGHLVMGLASGWKYCSFRVGNLTLVKRDGRLQWKKTTVAGTGGQCLMIPPECEPTKCPFFLYLLGGGLFNIVTGGIAFGIGMLTGGVAQVILNIFAIMGFGLGLSNLFPARVGGTMNDGYQIFIEFPHNPEAKKYNYWLLSAHAILTEIESTGEMPEKLKNDILNADYTNLGDTGTANLYCFKATILQDEGRYDECREIYQNIADSPDVLQLFKNEANCELMYHEIMSECNAERIDALYDKKLAEYIKATALYPSRKRLMYAYYLIYKNDKPKAEEEYNALLKTAKSHPSKAEGAIELREAERIHKYYENRGNLQEA